MIVRLDKQALRETLDQVIAADAVGLWDQSIWVGPALVTFEEMESLTANGIWSCGTMGCLAGHRAMMDGYTQLQWRRGLTGGITTWLVNPKTGQEVRDFKGWAKVRLGLTTQQAEVLFDADNTLEDLKRYVDIICDNGNIEAAQ
jgi:hypothetical protein